MQVYCMKAKWTRGYPPDGSYPVVLKRPTELGAFGDEIERYDCSECKQRIHCVVDQWCSKTFERAV